MYDNVITIWSKLIESDCCFFLLPFGILLVFTNIIMKRYNNKQNGKKSALYLLAILSIKNNICLWHRSKIARCNYGKWTKIKPPLENSTLIDMHAYFHPNRIVEYIKIHSISLSGETVQTRSGRSHYIYLITWYY